MILRDNFSELALVKQKLYEHWDSGTQGAETRQQKRESGNTSGHMSHSIFSSRSLPNDSISWRWCWSRGSWRTWSWQVGKLVISHRVTMDSITSKLCGQLWEPGNGGTLFQRWQHSETQWGSLLLYLQSSEMPPCLGTQSTLVPPCDFPGAPAISCGLQEHLTCLFSL